MGTPTFGGGDTHTVHKEDSETSAARVAKADIILNGNPELPGLGECPCKSSMGVAGRWPWFDLQENILQDNEVGICGVPAKDITRQRITGNGDREVGGPSRL